MKRKKKLILTGILAIIYVIIALNFHKIKFAFSMFRLYSRESKTESVVDNGEGNIKPIMDNPLDSIISQGPSVDNDGVVEDENNDSVDKVGDKDDSSEGSNENDDKGTLANNSKKSYTSIINEYNTVLQNLRNTFESELDDLIAQGIKDYNKGDLSTSQLASRYLFTGAELEKTSDSKFNAVVKDMERELKKNGHDTAITKEVKNYYNEFKNAKKTDLINRGMKRL